MEISFFPLFGVQFPFCDKHGGIAVFQHVKQPVNRIFAVHGNVSGPGFLDAQHSHHKFFTP